MNKDISNMTTQKNIFLNSLFNINVLRLLNLYV